MRVLFGALEFGTLLRVGGVAEALAGLGAALAKRGHAVAVALPRRAYGFPDTVDSVEVITLPVAGFERGSPYGHEVDPLGHGTERLAALAGAVERAVQQRASGPTAFDVVHLHDWPLGMAGYRLRGHGSAWRARTHSAGRPALVTTIHNGAFHGLFPAAALPHFGVPVEAAGALRLGGLCSSLKAAICAADRVTTVSPTYSRELRSPTLGFGLHELLGGVPGGLAGILHGLDPAAWDPGTDPGLAAPFGPDDVGGRTRCQAALAAELGFESTLRGPLLLFAGRLYPEKGADLLAGLFPVAAAAGLRLVVVGSGDPGIESRLRELAARHPRHTRVLPFAEDPQLRRLLAGADLVLLPSRREACGQLQLAALRYGALPVAHATGGLADTIRDLDSCPEVGTGVLFEPDTTEGLLAGIVRGLRALESGVWPALRPAAMRPGRTWDDAAADYERVYREAAAAATGGDHGGAGGAGDHSPGS